MAKSLARTNSQGMESQRSTDSMERRLLGFKTKLQSEQDCRKMAEQRIGELRNEVDTLKLERQTRCLEYQRASKERETAHEQDVERLVSEHQTFSEKKDRDHQQLVEEMEAQYQKLMNTLVSECELHERKDKGHEQVIKKMTASHDQLTREAESQRELLESKERDHQQLNKKMRTRFKEVVNKMTSDYESAETQTRKRHHEVVQELLARLKDQKEKYGQATQFMLSQYQTSYEENFASRKYYQDLAQRLTSERDEALQRVSDLKTIAADTIVEAKVYITMNHVIFDYQPELARQKTMLELMLPAGSRIISRMREGRHRWRELHQGDHGPDFERQCANLLDEFKGLPLCDEALFTAHRETLRRFRGIENGDILKGVDEREHDKDLQSWDLQRLSEDIKVTTNICGGALEAEQAPMHNDTKQVITEKWRESPPSALNNGTKKKSEASGTEESSVHMWQLRPQEITADAYLHKEPEETDADESDSERMKKTRRCASTMSSADESFPLYKGGGRRIKTESPLQPGRRVLKASGTASPSTFVLGAEEQQRTWPSLLNKFRYEEGDKTSRSGSGEAESQHHQKKVKREQTAE